MLPERTGWEIGASPDGNIIQSGVGTKQPSVSYDNTMGAIIRAVVIQVLFPEEDDRPIWTDKDQKCILCDVRTMGRQQRILQRVPVLQRTHGRYDTDVYIPRAAKTTLSGAPLVTMESKGAQPTPAEDLDGDHVLIGFLDNDPQQPVVLPFGFPHPKSAYRPEKADGRIKIIRHNGVKIEWSSDGDLTIDASKAAKDELAALGIEQSNLNSAGTIRVITKNTGGDESRVILSPGSAELDAPEITVGVNGAEYVVKHESWSSNWGTTKAAASAVGNAPPPSVATLSEWGALVKTMAQQIEALATKFDSVATTITKVG